MMLVVVCWLVVAMASTSSLNVPSLMVAHNGVITKVNATTNVMVDVTWSGQGNNLTEHIRSCICMHKHAMDVLGKLAHLFLNVNSTIS
jgi:hypothetical protein